MHPKVDKIFRKAEAERKAVLQLLKDVPDDKLHRAPDGKWSASQIVFHLIEAERISVIYIRKKYLGADTAGDTGLWEEMKYRLLRISQRLPLRYKAPAVLAQHSPLRLSCEELEARWQELREDFRRFLEPLPHPVLKKKLYRHVVAGRLNIYHALGFFNDHLQHHLPQIKRLLK